MNYWIGIDVSKKHLDLSLIDDQGEELCWKKISNEAKAIGSLLGQWSKRYGVDQENALVCMEPTGHYGYLLMKVLVDMQMPCWLAHPLDIKHSIGLTRGKNDQVDARRIAQYARRFCDKARLIDAQSLEMGKLKQLLSCRRRLVSDRCKHQVYIKDLNPCMDSSLRTSFDEISRQQLALITQQLKRIDHKVAQHIRSDKALNEQYELLLSVTGIGPVLAAHLLAVTEGFTRFRSARQLACQAGVAPYQHSSGSSVHGQTRVSQQADKQLKTLLHMAAMTAIQRSGELQTYYRRKLDQGKAPMSVLNAIRSKILHRAWAVVQRGTPFVAQPRNSLQTS